MGQDTGDGRAHGADVAAWKAIVAEYQTPSRWRAIWQLVDTIGAYVALWAIMYWTAGVSWWLTLPLAALAGMFQGFYWAALEPWEVMLENSQPFWITRIFAGLAMFVGFLCFMQAPDTKRAD